MMQACSKSWRTCCRTLTFNVHACMHCLSLLAANLQLLLAASNLSMRPAGICTGHSKDTVSSDLMTRTAVNSHTINIFERRSMGGTEHKHSCLGCSELTVPMLTLLDLGLQAGIQHIVFSGLFDTRPYFHHLPLTPSGRRLPHYETKAEITVCCSELST